MPDLHLQTETITEKKEVPQEDPQEHAAVAVQRAWRKYSIKRRELDPDARWKDTLINTKKKQENRAADEQKNDPASRWERGVFLAGRLRDGDALQTGRAADDDGNSDPSPVYTKDLHTEHWLELVDAKHRYGSNLKWYHKAWEEADTEENFFRWLDRGGGKNLDLPECSREQLDKERIIYLSREQRLNYLVRIDSDGKLRWARNNQYVDTTPKKWKDAGDGKGIIHVDGTEPPQIERKGSLSSSSSSSSSSSDSDVADALAHHYEGGPTNQGNVFQRVKSRFTTSGLMERLLRKTVRKNTWIYVSDKNYNVFVGLKDSGYFQHSSLTAGGLVTSAGLLQVRNGTVTSISPLSGHYRTSMKHFHQFVEEMEKKGLDVHRVTFTKGEVMLWGLEKWGQLQKKRGDASKKAKETVKHAVGQEPAKDGDENAKKEENTSSQPPPPPPPYTNRQTTESDDEKVFVETVEHLKEERRKEDEHWKTTAQWRWEVITGRARKTAMEGEVKWKEAMEKAEHAAHSGPSKQEQTVNEKVGHH